jgi:hypothetical protein
MGVTLDASTLAYACDSTLYARRISAHTNRSCPLSLEGTGNSDDVAVEVNTDRAVSAKLRRLYP